MSQMGQKRKGSDQAQYFRFAPGSGPSNVCAFMTFTLGTTCRLSQRRTDKQHTT